MGQGIRLESQAKEIISNVYRYFTKKHSEGKSSGAFRSGFLRDGHKEEMEPCKKEQKNPRERELLIHAKRGGEEAAERTGRREKRRHMIDESEEMEKLELEESMHDLESSWSQLEEEQNLLNCQVFSEGQLFYHFP